MRWLLCIYMCVCVLFVLFIFGISVQYIRNNNNSRDIDIRLISCAIIDERGILGILALLSVVFNFFWLNLCRVGVYVCIKNELAKRDHGFFTLEVTNVPQSLMIRQMEKYFFLFNMLHE